MLSDRPILEPAFKVLCCDKADASDSHRSPLLNCCLNPGDVSVREACGARPCGRHRLQLQLRT